MVMSLWRPPPDAADLAHGAVLSATGHLQTAWGQLCHRSRKICSLGDWPLCVQTFSSSTVPPESKTGRFSPMFIGVQLSAEDFSLSELKHAWDNSRWKSFPGLDGVSSQVLKISWTASLSLGWDQWGLVVWKYSWNLEDLIGSSSLKERQDAWEFSVISTKILDVLLMQDNGTSCPPVPLLASWTLQGYASWIVWLQKRKVYCRCLKWPGYWFRRCQI